MKTIALLLAGIGAGTAGTVTINAVAGPGDFVLEQGVDDFVLDHGQRVIFDTLTKSIWTGQPENVSDLSCKRIQDKEKNISFSCSMSGIRSIDAASAAKILAKDTNHYRVIGIVK